MNMKLEYVSTDIQQLSFEKEVEKNTTVHIQTHVTYQVLYSDDGQSCVAVFSVEVSPKDPNVKLSIIYRAQSEFRLNDIILNDEVKKKLHVEIYHRLYPLHSANLKTFTNMVNLQGIKLPITDFTNMDIDITKNQ